MYCASSNNRRLCLWILPALVACTGLLSCNPSETAPPLSADTLPQTPLVTPPVPSLAVDAFPANLFAVAPELVYGILAEEPQVIPLEGWESNVPVTLGEVLQGDAVDHMIPTLQQAVSVNPMRYTHLELTLAVDDGDRLALWWDKPAAEGAPPHTSMLILADGESHTYLAPLVYGDGIPWRRPIDELVLAPSDAASGFRLIAARFVALPPEQPLRLTLDRTTMPTSRLTHFDCALPPLPEGGTLSVGLGSPGNPINFQILHRTGDAEEVLLTQIVSEPGWELVSLELPPTPQDSHVLFRQASGYWGAPVLGTHTAEDDAVAERQPIPVILISHDTLRADHLGCYGYERDTSPVIDAFAEDAVLFEEAFTPEAYTLTAHMSMLTGLYPKHHGMTENLNLREEVVTLAEALQAEDYLSGSFVGMEWWFAAWRGYAQGFHTHSVPQEYRSVFETYSLGRNWLEHLPNDRFFLFLHNYDLHSKMDFGLPYDANDERFRQFSAQFDDPPAFPAIAEEELGATLYLARHNYTSETMSEEQRAYLRALYDDCILKADFATGEFLDYLKAHGWYDNALIIMTSDHGEAFGEHGRYLHGDVYEHNIQVPLLIKFPHQQYAGARVKGLVELTDLYPTILDAVGAATPEEIDGISLIPAIEAQASHRDAVFATRGSWRAVRTPTDKLIRQLVDDQTEYYDLSADPEELENKASALPERAAELREDLESFFAPAPGGWQVALYAGDTAWKLDFVVSSTGVFDSVRLAHSNAVEQVDRVSASQRVGGTIDLTPQVAEDVLLVKPAQGHEEIRLFLESERPFSVRLGEEMLAPEETFEAILSPNDARLQTPPPALDAPVYPHVAIWYEAPQVSGTAAQELSEEDLEALKALGYLGEDLPAE